jgi:hypothetical protein
LMLNNHPGNAGAVRREMEKFVIALRERY